MNACQLWTPLGGAVRRDDFARADRRVRRLRFIHGRMPRLCAVGRARRTPTRCARVQRLGVAVPGVVMAELQLRCPRLCSGVEGRCRGSFEHRAGDHCERCAPGLLVFGSPSGAGDCRQRGDQRVADDGVVLRLVPRRRRDGHQAPAAWVRWRPGRAATCAAGRAFQAVSPSGAAGRCRRTAVSPRVPSRTGVCRTRPSPRRRAGRRGRSSSRALAGPGSRAFLSLRAVVNFENRADPARGVGG